MQEELSYANPLAPESSSRLTNDDFRKLLATPRAVSATATSRSDVADSDASDNKLKKKTFVPKVKKEEAERAAELAAKYRDRAKERRDGVNLDYQEADNTVNRTSGYKSVAPDADLSTTAEKRKREIDESKFLGGDLKHTHLVKGLDYVLKQKKLETMHVQKEEDETQKNLKKKKKDSEKSEEEITFHTVMAKNVCRTLFVSKPPLRNELFAPGRMAYVFELDEEYAESDIPTTLIRSKADCPQAESHSTLSTNDIVISKLTQILSYLRSGSRGKKGKKEKSRGKVEEAASKGKSNNTKSSGIGIWDNVGEYVPDTKKSVQASKKTENYFGTSDENESKDVVYKPLIPQDLVKNLAQKYDRSEGIRHESGERKGGMIEAGWSSADLDLKKQLTGESEKPPEKKADDKAGKLVGLENSSLGTYAECYPGGMEEMDAAYDSDEDADYTKMDLGSKKGPVKRWDFENEEDYSNYQSNREALPKAAFQYGRKMNDGRKTRRSKGGKSDMEKINKEWQQISAILSKRKGGNNEGASSAKRPKDD